MCVYVCVLDREREEDQNCRADGQLLASEANAEETLNIN